MPQKGLFDAQMKFLILVMGVATSSFLFILYLTLLSRGFNPELVRTFIFACFGSYSLFIVFSVRHLEASIFAESPLTNPYLVAGSAVGLALMFAAIYLPVLQGVLDTVPLPLPWLLGALLVCLTIVTIVELAKWVFRRYRASLSKLLR